MIYILFYLLFMVTSSGALQTQEPSLHKEITQAQASDGIQQPAVVAVAQKLFSVPANTSLESLNSQAVALLFGPEGLNVTPEIRSYCNYFYFYLEYVVKREQAAKLIAAAQKANKPFPDSILVHSNNSTTYDWSKLYAVTQEPLANIIPTTENWIALDKALQGSLLQERKSWQDLSTTSFWNDIHVTDKDLTASIFWQNYLKFIITKTVALDNGLLYARYQNERGLFKYLPNIEVAFFHPDFTELRTSAELTSISLVLNERIRNRSFDDCNDWKRFRNPKNKQINGDLLLQAVKQFTSTDFYQTATTYSSLDSKTAQSPFEQAASDQPITLKNVALPSPLAEQITCLSMILLLQTVTYNLFTDENLEKTTLALKHITQKPVPLFLNYTADDYVYLRHLADLSTSVKQAAQTVASSKSASTPDSSVANDSATDSSRPERSIKLQIMGSNWMKKTAKEIWDTVKDTGEAAFASAKELATAAEDEAKTFYYSSGIANKFFGVPKEQAHTLARTYADAVNKDLTSFNNDIDQLIQDSIKLMAFPGYAALDAVFSGLGQIWKDPALSQDFEGTWNALISGLAETIAAPLEVGTMLIASGAALSVDAIALIANIVVNVETPGEMGEAIKEFGYDMVSTVLANVTFTMGKVKETLQDLITTCGYLIKLLTDVIVDVGSSVDALARYAAQGLGAGTVSFSDYYSQAQTQIASHQRLISSLVTTGLIVGLTVVTGGTGTAMIPGLVMALGMGALMTTGAYQDDEKVAESKQELHDYVENFNVWTTNREFILQAQQESITSELNQKLQDELSNRQRDLGFYQNFLNATFNGLVEQNSAILGAYQAARLTPDSQGIMHADVGAPYGYSTGWLDLNPSQGFPLYEPARHMLSQEIAAQPARFKTAEGTVPRFWFTQNILKELNQSPQEQLTYEIRFRAIYTLDIFYAGIYIGGNPINPQKIIAQQKADPDQAHLAKMAVFKKEDSQADVSFGIYEHESELYQSSGGWIPTNISAPHWRTGTWYHIKVQLQGNQLEVKVWQDGQTESSASTTVTVTPTSQNIIGIIFSGISLEYEVVTPDQETAFKPASTTIEEDYKKNQVPDVKEREAKSQADYQKLYQPPFGTVILEGIDSYEILKGNYVYRTSSTAIAQHTGNKISQDYIVFGIKEEESNAITELGNPPHTGSLAVSVITGHAYDQQGNTRLQQAGIWPAYTASHPTISTQVTHEILEAQKSYAKILSEPFIVGPFTLTATNAEDIQAGNFMYTVKTNINPDYVIMATLEDNTPTQTGMLYSPADKTINGFVSLVTGNAYSNASLTPVAKGFGLLFSQYRETHPNLRKELVEEITKAREAYQKTRPEIGQQSAPVTPIPAATTSEQISDQKVTPDDSQLTVVPPSPPAQSLTQRQDEASSWDDSGGW